MPRLSEVSTSNTTQEKPERRRLSDVSKAIDNDISSVNQEDSITFDKIDPEFDPIKIDVSPEIQLANAEVDLNKDSLESIKTQEEVLRSSGNVSRDGFIDSFLNVLNITAESSVAGAKFEGSVLDETLNVAQEKFLESTAFPLIANITSDEPIGVLERLPEKVFGLEVPQRVREVSSEESAKFIAEFVTEPMFLLFGFAGAMRSKSAKAVKKSIGKKGGKQRLSTVVRQRGTQPLPRQSAKIVLPSQQNGPITIDFVGAAIPKEQIPQMFPKSKVNVNRIQTPDKVVRYEVQFLDDAGQRIAPPENITNSVNLANNIATAPDISTTGKVFAFPRRIANHVDRSFDGAFHKLFFLVQRSFDRAFRFEQTMRHQMRQKMKEFGIKQKDSQKLRAFIEGNTQFPSRNFFGRNVLRDLKLTSKQKSSYKKMSDWMRTQYDDVLTQVNAARAKVGKKPIPRRENYVHHMREMSVLDEMFGGLTRVPDEVMSRYIKAKTPAFSPANPRYDALSEFDLAGALGAFESYMIKASRSIHMTKSITKVRDAARLAGHMERPNLSAALNKWADDIAHVPEAGILNDVMHTPVGSAIRFIVNRAVPNVISGSMTTVINQILAVPQIAAEIGIPRTLSALTKQAIKTPAAWFIRRFVNPEYGTFSRRMSRVVRDRVKQSIPEVVRSTQLSATERALSSPLRFMDVFMVETAWNGAFANFMKGVRNPTLAAVKTGIRHADDVAARTNAEYIRVLRPAIIRSQAGSTLLPLSNIIFNNANQVVGDFARLSIGKKLAAYTNLVTSSYLTRVALQQIKPSNEPILAQMLSDVVPGLQTGRLGLPGIAQLMNLFDERRSVQSKAIDFMATLLPPFGGLQLKRVLQGTAAISDNGWVRDKNGRRLFRIRTEADRLRAILFGPYLTQASKERFSRKKK